MLRNFVFHLPIRFLRTSTLCYTTRLFRRQLSSSAAEIIYGKESHENYSFESNFYVKQTRSFNLQNVPEGGYVDITPDIIEEYLPEGLAGEVAEEFQFTARHTWMIRESGKLLCRLVEEFEYLKLSRLDRPEAPVKTKSFHLPIEVEGLTDRPEWNGAKMTLKHYSNDIMRDKVFSDDESNIDRYVSELKAIGFPTKYLLTGDRGVGKSTILNQTVLHARQRGWLCLFIPSAWTHVHGGYFIEPCIIKGTIGLYDNVFETVKCFRGFWRAHAKQLRELPIQNTEAMRRYDNFLSQFRVVWDRVRSLPGRGALTFIKTRALVEDEDNFPTEDEQDDEILSTFDFNTFELKTLEDIILLAIALRDIAGPLFMDLVEELKNLQSVPVLIAIDQYNTWHGRSVYKYEQRPIYAKDLCVSKALNALSYKKAETNDWVLKNGLVICANSSRHPEGLKDNFKEALRSVPIAINVPIYSQIEYLSAFKYLTSLNRIDGPFTTQELLAYRSHIGSNPALLRKESVGYLLPISTDKTSPELQELSSISNPSNNSYTSGAGRGRYGSAAGVTEGLLGGYDDEDGTKLL